jgi:HK97 family phage portal protein
MSTLGNPAKWFIELLNGGDDGPRVMPETMLKVPSMWYAVNRICSHVGQLPVDLKRSLTRGSETVTSDYRWKLLRTRPNNYQTPSVFKEQLTAHMLMCGDGRAYIAKRGSRIAEIIPIDPKKAVTGMVKGEKLHLVKVDPDSRLALYVEPDKQDKVVLFDDEVIHLPNLSIDGVSGEKLFEHAAQTIKASVSADKRTAKSMAKGFTGKMMLEAPKGAFRNEKDAQDFLKNFKEQHSANENGEDIGLLREEIKANVLNMTNHDAQFIEQRAFARQEAALWFLLESIIGDDSSVSYNSLEQKTLSYLQNTLNRWLRRSEEEFDYKLLSEKEQDSYYFKFNTGALLRSDLTTTMAALNVAVQSRIMSPNEAREKLDMNPYEGGDTYANPAITPGTADQATTTARAAVVSRLQGLLAVEEQRVTDALSKQNPMKKIEAFYSRWKNTLGKAIEEMGGDKQIAIDHCIESVEALMTGADCHKPVNTAEQLADLILKGNEDV